MGLKNKPAYHRRLFIWLVGYSLLLAGCVVVFQYHREKEFKADEVDGALQLINQHIINELSSGTDMGNIRVEEPYPFEELRVSVIDSLGKVVYDNTLDTLPGTNHLDRREIRAAERYGSGYTLRRHSESTGNTYFYSARKGDGGYIVRTAVPYSMSLGEILKADYGFLWVIGIITLAMCILGYFATKKIGELVTRLNIFAERAERGERIYDTEPFPKDELGAISHHIVRLYARLQQANADRDREHRAALREQQEKERMKKQLTNNINHELKTPVTSIQVCIETLLAHKELPEAKREEFLERCLANTERLKRMLADVSLITRMDEGGNMIAKEPTDLSAIISEVVTELQPTAKARGIDIVNKAAGEKGLRINGNNGLLASVFRNLIDNAISYSGGTEIDIEIKARDAHKVVIQLSDNGCGVAEEHLPHLFTRFYRVDKGRSRAMGGTGLGLSIVRNAVRLHGGTISVENKPAGGLVFTITFPLQR